jgi:nucleolar protein 58|tara:strand:- start:217 stop:684 length:468 start_codon:yes stop_codon:yes gene_type:complete
VLQAIGLLDDLDKELNTYAMRLREWYGWHFPELGKIVPDHQMYAKALMKMGVRTQCKSLDFSDILPEEVEHEMKDAAEISMGTEVSEDDIANILQLCDQVVSLSEYRAQLWDYLRNRMQAHTHHAAPRGHTWKPPPAHTRTRTHHTTPHHTTPGR